MEIAVLPESEYRRQAGLRLRRLIDMLGLRYVEAARIMNVSKNVLRNWMAGEAPVQPYPLYRLCAVKLVDFNYIHLGDWSRLPEPVRKALEDEALSALAAAEAGTQADASLQPASKRSRKRKQPINTTS